ncbi:hypothetical protein N658DRAFT_151629 [Parathielavia hyrcaniae]|uniref:Uncharacterized protein n=1 Tax=Parathielavia hyrcaniae TaxID=113614 RepID=A0AAN6PPN3_9PEZI|nr:hypothetical protein N658DRAFT_151629 [Parathielavia hyrcaniae]
MYTSGIRHAYVMQASAPGPSLKAWSHAHPVMVVLALFVQYHLYVQADQTVCVVPVTPLIFSRTCLIVIYLGCRTWYSRRR